MAEMTGLVCQLLERRNYCGRLYSYDKNKNKKIMAQMTLLVRQLLERRNYCGRLYSHLWEVWDCQRDPHRGVCGPC